MQLTSALTTVRHVNKTDAVSLGTAFGVIDSRLEESIYLTFKEAVVCDSNALALGLSVMIPGNGSLLRTDGFLRPSSSICRFSSCRIFCDNADSSWHLQWIDGRFCTVPWDRWAQGMIYNPLLSLSLSFSSILLHGQCARILDHQSSRVSMLRSGLWTHHCKNGWYSDGCVKRALLDCFILSSMKERFRNWQVSASSPKRVWESCYASSLCYLSRSEHMWVCRLQAMAGAC